jgi:hypothetical protein
MRNADAQTVRTQDVQVGDRVFVSDRRSLVVDEVVTAADWTLVFISGGVQHRVIAETVTITR